MNHRHLNVSVAVVTDSVLLSGKGPGVKYHIRDLVINATVDTVFTLSSGGVAIIAAKKVSAEDPLVINGADLFGERGNLLVTNTAGVVSGVITYFEENMGAKQAQTPTQRLPQY